MYKLSLENRHRTTACPMQTYIDLLEFPSSQISSESDLVEAKASISTQR